MLHLSISVLLFIVATSIIAAAVHAVAVPGPYPPAAGWSYIFEAVLNEPWPSCRTRFLSFNAPKCSLVNLWNSAGFQEQGANQQFKLVKPATSSGNSSVFHIAAAGSGNCGNEQHFLAYSSGSDCSRSDVFLSSRPSEWEVVNVSEFEVLLVAVGRKHCPGGTTVLTAPARCMPAPAALALTPMTTSSSPQRTLQLWRPIASLPPSKKYVLPTTKGFCADPFIWQESWQEKKRKMFISCTGGEIELYDTTLPGSDNFINASTRFEKYGTALGAGSKAPWLKANARWAPEVLHLPEQDNMMIMVVGDVQPGLVGEPHRLGFVVRRGNETRQQSFQWYSEHRIDLNVDNAVLDWAGEIDAHFHRCEKNTGKTYLVWKQDDNRLALPTTRIYAAEISIDARNFSQPVKLLTKPTLLLDSCSGKNCFFFLEGFLGPSSTLIEGPEILAHPNGYHYLFFAAERYNDPSYNEGVARSSNGIFGPYEVMPRPLISTGVTGYDAETGKKILGTGHAGFIRETGTTTGQQPKTFAVFHGHVGGQPRKVWGAAIVINEKTGWPEARLEHFF